MSEQNLTSNPKGAIHRFPAEYQASDLVVLTLILEAYLGCKPFHCAVEVIVAVPHHHMHRAEIQSRDQPSLAEPTNSVFL